MMANRIENRNGQRLLVLEVEDPALASLKDMLDLIGEALSQRVTVIVVPVARLDPVFFRLSSGLAGEFVQKIVNYRFRLAVVGDISPWTAANKSFADFVRESNRGDSVFFVPDLEALGDKLSYLSEPG